MISRRLRVSKTIKNMVMTEAKREEIDRPDIVFLGDSNTAISYFEGNPELRWTQLVEDSLGLKTFNYGADGRSTFDYLKPDSYTGEDRINKIIGLDAKYYVICFGLNDEKYINVSEFESDTRTLVEQIQMKTKGTPIIITNVWVDYPDHYSYDRNMEKIKPFDDVKRVIADELGLDLIDVYKRFKQEYEQNGIWDTRIRTTSVWDDSEDSGKGVSWFNNIHYNVLGNEIVADEIVKYFNKHILN